MNLNVKIVIIFTAVIFSSVGILVGIDQSDSNSSMKLDFIVDQNIVNANNQFALDFYSKLSTESNDENLFFSPTSISTAFAILYEGAEGNTADEMQETFGFEPDDSKRRDGFADMQRSLNPQDEQYKLRLANALWLANGFEPLPEYTDTAATYYDSNVESLDFSSGKAVETINRWVDEKTEGKIEKLFDNLSSATQLVITNAIYFKGEWVHQFDSERTKDMQFWTFPEESVMVPTMSLSRTDLKYARDEQVSILELPYKGDDLSMLILLPERTDGLKSIEESLTLDRLSELKSNLKTVTISVSIPKFTMETDYDLKKHLSEMGMDDAFDGMNADLSGISGAKGLFVGNAIHKAFVDVNEEGTEAAAVTGIAVLQSGLTFRADHPFLFVIQEKETGQILFMGRMMDPTK